MAIFAVNEHTFEIDTTPAGIETLAEVTDVESVDITVDGVTIDWNALDSVYTKRRKTGGVSIELAFSGKRNFGDTGNDYVAGLAFAVGDTVETTVKITTNEATPTTYTIPVVVQVTSIIGGESTDVSVLEWTASSNGTIVVA